MIDIMKSIEKIEQDIFYNNLYQKALPVGTVRDRKDGKYKKMPDGSWKKITTEDRGEKEEETSDYRDKDKNTFYSNHINDVLNYVQDKYADNEDLAGIRVMSPSFDDYDKKKGDSLSNSQRWELGQPTGEDLGGVSTIGINAGETEPGYHGDKIVVVGSHQGAEAGWAGEDNGEVVVPDPYIIDIITREEYDTKIKPMYEEKNKEVQEKREKIIQEIAERQKEKDKKDKEAENEKEKKKIKYSKEGIILNNGDKIKIGDEVNNGVFNGKVKEVLDKDHFVFEFKIGDTIFTEDVWGTYALSKVKKI
jgi:hypothetical protein